MYSLEQLNQYSSLTSVFTDERPTSYTTVPANLVGISSTVISTEDATHQLAVPFTITSAIAIDMVYTINVKAYSGATVTWSALPVGVVYSNPSAGIYRLTNIQSISKWEAVKSPTVYLGPDRSGPLPYTANLVVGLGGDTISWTINADLASLDEINTGTLPSLFFDEDIAITANTGLVITDTTAGASYQIRVSKSENLAGSLSSAGSVNAVSSYSANVLTITGNKSSVNSHLANLTYTPTSGYLSNFNLNYQVTNQASNVVSYAGQTVFVGNVSNGISNIHLDRNYTTNTTNTLFSENIPQITETVPSNAQYTMVLQFVSPSTPITVIADDPYQANVQLLLQGSNMSVIEDVSQNDFSPVVSTVSVSSAQHIFSDNSIFFNGSSLLSYPNNANLQPRNDFTIEAYVYPTITNDSVAYFSYGPYGGLILYTDPNGNFRIDLDKDGSTGSLPDVYNVNLGVGPSYNIWQHLAVSRSGNTVRVFKNGTQIGGNITLSGNITQVDNLTFGSISSTGGMYYRGYMEQVRYTQGIARYTANFTPPGLMVSGGGAAENIGFIAEATDYITRPNWNISQLSYTFTGTKEQCNAKFAQLKLYPYKDNTSDIVVKYTQYKNGFYQLERQFDLYGNEFVGTIPGVGVYEFASTTTFNPTYEQLYILNTNILLAGPGGRGGFTTRGEYGQGVAPFRSIARYFGGGGGGGLVRQYNNLKLIDYVNTSPITISIPPPRGLGEPTAVGSLSAPPGGNGGDATYTQPPVVYIRTHYGTAGGGGSSYYPGGPTVYYNTVLLEPPGEYTAAHGGGGGGLGGSGLVGSFNNGGAGGPGQSITFAGITRTYGAGGAGANGGGTPSGSPGQAGYVIIQFTQD